MLPHAMYWYTSTAQKGGPARRAPKAEVARPASERRAATIETHPTLPAIRPPFRLLDSRLRCPCQVLAKIYKCSLRALIARRGRAAPRRPARSSSLAV
jgi:hypothetical protein